jgi:hemerythrin
MARPGRGKPFSAAMGCCYSSCGFENSTGNISEMAIKKIKVSKGVLWVEFPEADLRVLCGCPADSIKHLIKKGMVVSQEVKGVACETGPNAILLSDLGLQKGEFANLAEFPVLQMLYRQGMILPNHPNNTGEKPLIIGMGEQVNAQMNYIYRGNYGLVSREEIIQTGIAEDVADKMMRLNLRFAFGRIQSTNELLESRVVGNEQVEIRNGVFIRRLSLNVYEFEYEGETVSVDLNLAPGETYESAYPLGFRNIERGYFSVVHSGEGDGWDINRPSMSSILTFQGKIYLIDAGPNLSVCLAALGISIDEIEGIFHTHAHDDHFAGITTLMRSGHRIKYFAAPLVRATVAKKISALLSVEEEAFNDYFDIHDLEFDSWNNIEGLEVKPIFSPHPVETSIFIFRSLWADGYRSYAHFADIVALDVLEGMITDSADEPGLSKEDFQRTKDAYLTPAEVKKIDIGGGLIHGVAKDFREDKSGKILLAHKAQDLTPEEKEIGSNAPFGSVDTLIFGSTDPVRRAAFSYLEAHFSGIPLHHTITLINNEIAEINPGSIVMREGETPKEILILLSGRVEKIRTKDNFLSTLSAGAILGDPSDLQGRASKYTYRAAAFIKILKIPLTLYAEIIKQNHLTERLERTHDLRLFFESTGLFGEGVSAAVLAQIIDQIKTLRLNPGESIECRDLELLNVIKSGSVERSVGSEVLDTLRKGDFFGEEGAVFKVPCLYRLRTIEKTDLYQIPGNLIDNVPIVRWKLFESYLARTTQIIHSGDEDEILVWRDAFNVDISTMDIHHKRLVEIANSIMGILRSKGDKGSLMKAFSALVDYTHYHFKAEEEVLERYGYPGIEGHKKTHKKLIKQVSDYYDSILDGAFPEEGVFQKFFEGWLIKHILDEDRKYGAFLNSKGVY